MSDAYKYTNHGFLVEARVLDADNGKEYDLSNCIEDVMIRKRYIQDSFPLVVLDLRTTEEMRDIMRDDEVSIYLRVSYFNVDSSETPSENDSVDVVPIGNIFDGVIRIYEKPFSTTVSKVEEEGDDTKDQKSSVPLVYYRVSGIPEELIKLNEGSMNAIYEDASLTDVLVHEISSINPSGKIIIEPLNNVEVYKNVYVPPVSFIESLNFLDSNYYHFYRDGFNVFLDNNVTYFYNPVNSNLSGNILEMNIIGSAATDNMEKSNMPKLSDNNDIRISYFNVPEYGCSKKIISHSLGSQTIYYYYDENFNIVSKQKTNDESFTKLRYIWEPLHDNSSEILNKSESLSFTIQSLNPELITPLTVVRVVSSEYPQVAGDYMITELVYILSSGDMKHYGCNTSILAIKK